LAEKWWGRRALGRLSDLIKRTRGDMAHPVRRALGRFETVFIDHAFFRWIYFNRHAVTPAMWRAAQPGPGHIRRLAAEGIKTIVNLRGRRDCASYILEAEACRRFGVTLVDFPVNSRSAPKAEMIARADEMFRSIEYPALMHCKSGADRAGLMSALFLTLREGEAVESATRHLSWRYGHFRQARTGILDHFFEMYITAAKRNPVPFREWVARDYSEEECRSGFRSARWADTMVDKVLERE